MGEKIVCVVGPTASGKTGLGVALAKRYGGEVVSVDSMQIYRGMAIGTAAPTEEEQQGVPHHMIAIADPRESFSVARFAALATDCIEDILHRGRLPILVGGTGLYLDAIVRGTVFAPGTQDGAVRRDLQERLEREGIAPLLDELSAIDPAAAARLAPADEKRILRALEVYRETGTTITEHNAQTQKIPPRYDASYLGLAFREREEQRRRIALRVSQMAAEGLVDEVRALLASGVPESATALQAIGYKELLPALRGESTVEEGLAEITLRSCQYAKRQLTWLRRNPAIHWIFWEKSPDFEEALRLSTEFLTARGVG
ncbi:MAG: tRNA (adenosine(37)-N6)-dimethylallyltransferase MiaA [Oscillospiraceae bacterium]